MVSSRQRVSGPQVEEGQQRGRNAAARVSHFHRFCLSSSTVMGQGGAPPAGYRMAGLMPRRCRCAKVSAKTPAAPRQQARTALGAKRQKQRQAEGQRSCHRDMPEMHHTGL